MLVVIKMTTELVLSSLNTSYQLQKAALREPLKIIVGGACVTQQYADEIGADGYADNAGAAVDKAKALLRI